MQKLKKIKKLINQASSDTSNEAQQAAKMASAFMVRNGINFADLLIYKDSLYIDGLMLTVKSYAQRTTKNNHEAQKVSARLYKQINDAYHPPKAESPNYNKEEKTRLQREREALKQKAERLRKKEAEILRKQHEQNTKPQNEPIHATDFKTEETAPPTTKTSHNIKIANYFLRMLVKHPVLTARLFIKSLISALVVSFAFMVLIFIFSIIFDMDLTFNLSYLTMYEGLVFVLLIAYTLVNIRNHYPNE